MAEKRQGENEVEHPRKKNCFAVRQPSLAVADVLRQSGRAAVPQYCKLPTACLRSIEPEAFSGSASTSIREDFGTKTEVSHDEGFISARHRGLLFGRRKNPQVRASLNSRVTDGPRLPPWDTSVFVPRFALGAVLFQTRPPFRFGRATCPSERSLCLFITGSDPFDYRAAILRMPCSLDASSSIPISSSAW